MSSDDESVVVAAAATVISAAAEAVYDDKRKDREWEGQITRRRANNSAYTTVVPHLLTSPDDSLPPNRLDTFKNYFRMTKSEFDHLHNLVSPIIAKMDTSFREAISTEERLMVTLRYLATGSSLTSLHYEWCISTASLSSIIYEVCEAIYKVLKDDHLKTPKTAAEWMSVSQELEKDWDFPHVIGALDGKHIQMNKPWKAGSEYHNYKGTESLVLMAMCDNNYRFTYIDCGAEGRISDGGVFRVSTLAEHLEKGTLHLPPAELIAGEKEPMPYVIVADEAFPLKEYLMRPYPQRQLDYRKRVFNYRLSRVRRLIENTFGIFTATWRVFLTQIALQPDKVKIMVLACCALHNFLRCNGTVGANSEEGSHTLNLPGLPAEPLRPTNNALRIRELFCDYFNGAGDVPFQHTSIAAGN